MAKIMSKQNESMPWGMELKTFCMLLHLSQLAGYIIPGAGLILPIVMWATNKDEYPIVNEHGKSIFNWMISGFIYAFICFLLIFILIGFLGFFVLGLCGIIFAIIGAIKASENEIWDYPLSIQFFKVNKASDL